MEKGNRMIATCQKFSIKQGLLPLFFSFFLVSGDVWSQPYDMDGDWDEEELSLKQGGPDCPAPTVVKGNHCILEGDATITKTLHLKSGTTLDCRGHKLIASAPGVLDNPGTPANEYQTSVPEVALYALQVDDIDVRQCAFQGFDFDAVVADSKNPAHSWKGPRIRFLKNTFTANYMGVLAVKADDVVVRKNTFTGTGVAVVAIRSSDRIRVRYNTIIMTANLLGRSPIFPGNRTFVNIGVNPALDLRNGFGFPMNPGGTTILPLVVDGALSQFPLEDPPADGLFTDNTITFTGNGAFTCFDMSDASTDARFLENDCSTAGSGSALHGVFMSGAFGNAVTASGAGHCTQKQDRLCSNNFDCNIPGFDPAGGNDTCSGAVVGFLDSRPRGTLIEGNRITGNFLQRGISADEIYDPVIKGNAVTGAPTAIGIFLRSRAVESSTVEENRLLGNNFGIFLSNGGNPTPPPNAPPGTSPFGAVITHNEILSSLTRAIGATGGATPWVFPADLPANYWGRDCTDSGAFRNFDEPDNGGKTDSPTLAITDSSPFGESILEQDPHGFLDLIRPLPLTCAEQGN